MKKYLIVSLTVILNIFGQSLFAQQEDIRFARLSIEEGLSQSSILAFCQDSKGFIWIGTADGLNRYDGNEFKIYRRDLNNLQNSLPNNQVSALLEDRQGYIWVGTGGGLTRFDPRTETFRNFMFDADSTPFSKVLSILQDREGFLWFATLEKGLKKYDPRTEQMTIHRSDSKNPNSISYNAVYGLIEDKEGRIWIGTGGGGINIFDKKTGKFKTLRHNPADPENSLSSDIAGTVSFSLDENTVWIGSYGFGLNRLDKETGKFTHYKHDPRNPYSISDNRIDKIFRTQSGEIWICSESGLDKLIETPDSVYFIRYKNQPTNLNSLSDNHAFLMYEDAGGILWVGTYRGGLSRFDPKRKKFGLYRQNPNDPQSLSNNAIRSVMEDRDRNLWINTTQGGLNKITYKNRLENKQFFVNYKPDPANEFSISSEKGANLFQDKEGRIWIGTNGDGLNLYENDQRFIRIQLNPKDSLSIPNNRIRAMYQDRKGRFWIGTVDGISLFDPLTLKIKKHYKSGKNGDQKKLSHYHIRQITEDRSGFLWITTDGGGLNRFDPEKEIFTHYLNKPNDKNTIADNRVTCLYIDKEDIIWLGTAGGGLNRFDPRTEKFTFLVEENGLPNNAIYGILPDNRGNLWISTNKGLSKFDPKTKKFRNYSVNDGLQSDEFNLNAFFRSPSGELFFGGISGLTFFYPDSIKDNDYQAPIVLSDFKIRNKSVHIYGKGSPLKQHISYTSSMTLSHEENNFTIEFAALHYGMTGKKRYQYRLRNYQEEWIEADEKRSFASFTNLREGTYIFEVRGTNTDGVWSKQIRQLEITIKPPFWASVWFVTLCTLSLLGSAFGFYRLRISQIKAQKRILEELVKARTIEVLQQKEALEAQNRDIRASIQYAKSIQDAMLLSEEDILAILPEAFVFLKPRDIVSGDFYWIGKVQNKTLIVAADCTGHGVPGAFMSLIGNDLLNEIIRIQECTNPKIILEYLHKGIRNSLKQAQNNSRDGMEMAVAVADHEAQTLTFAGAGLPIIYCYEDKMYYLKGNMFGVGGSQNPEDIKFENHLIPCQNTIFYLYSDGYQDQFGGENRKYMSKRFKEFLYQIHKLPLQEQRSLVEQNLKNWQTDYKQVDDILVIGFRV